MFRPKYAAAIIIRNNKILLLQRQKSDDEGDKWSPPNETIEKGETPESAIIRGVKEETNLNFFVERQLDAHFFHNKSTCVYVGKAVGKIKINLGESQNYGWFSYEETTLLRFAFKYDELIRWLHQARLF